MIEHAPETVAQIQEAMMAGVCVEFDYRADGAAEPKWRRVIPLGLIDGAATYLVGQIPGRDL
jgi:predicted DNA-binding transcriptional regulator YafY